MTRIFAFSLLFSLGCEPIETGTPALNWDEVTIVDDFGDPVGNAWVVTSSGTYESDGQSLTVAKISVKLFEGMLSIRLAEELEGSPASLSPGAVLYLKYKDEVGELKRVDLRRIGSLWLDVDGIWRDDLQSGIGQEVVVVLYINGVTSKYKFDIPSPPVMF